MLPKERTIVSIVTVPVEVKTEEVICMIQV